MRHFIFGFWLGAITSFVHPASAEGILQRLLNGAQQPYQGQQSYQNQQPYQGQQGYVPTYRDQRQSLNGSRDTAIEQEAYSFGYRDPVDYVQDAAMARVAQNEAAGSMSRTSWRNPRSGNSGTAWPVGSAVRDRSGSVCQGIEEQSMVNGNQRRNRGNICSTAY